MSTSTTHNTTTTNDAGFPPAPGETHQKTSCKGSEGINAEFSLFLQVHSADQLKNAAMAHQDAEDMTADAFENDDSTVNLTACLQMLLDPGSLPGCEILDSAVEASE